jgi:peptide/nickel transport system substrate-binding protein
MAIDRDAIIKSVYFGQGTKIWAPITPASKKWNNPSVQGADYDPEGAKALLAKLGFKDRDHDGVLEDAGGHPVSFTITTNSGNTLRVQTLNFIRDDLAKIGIRCTPAPLEFNALLNNVRVTFDYDACLLGSQSGVPPDPAMGQNVWKSSGPTHYWHVREAKPDTPAEAEIDQLTAANVTTIDMAERHRTWDRITTILNDQAFMIWIPTVTLKVPVRNRFGNVHPTVIPNRLLWNVDRIFVKPRGARA